jgi:hypothetical protein
MHTATDIANALPEGDGEQQLIAHARQLLTDDTGDTAATSHLFLCIWLGCPLRSLAGPTRDKGAPGTSQSAPRPWNS